MKLFTKFALISVVLDLIWHSWKFYHEDLAARENRAKRTFREQWMASRIGKGVTQIIVSVTGMKYPVSPAPVVVTWSGGGGGSGYYYTSGGNGGNNGN